MQIISTPQRVSRFVLAVAAVLPLLLSPIGAMAQGPGGPGGAGGGGGFQMTPEMRAGFEKFQKFRENNKQVFALGQTIRAFGEMDKDAKTKFTPAQAKTILAVINKWKGKPSITNEQATQINKDLTKPLTVPQIKKLASEANSRRGFGGGGQGGGGGRPGGGGGQGGPGGGGPRMGGGGGQGGPGGGGQARMGGGGGGGFKMPELKPFNPLNPETGFSRNKEMAIRRMNELTTMLATRAKSK